MDAIDRANGLLERYAVLARAELPAGYELTTLVHGILEAGRAAPGLGNASLERLAAIDQDVAIDVYVTPT